MASNGKHMGSTVPLTVVHGVGAHGSGSIPGVTSPLRTPSAAGAGSTHPLVGDRREVL
jgi:hypothetical protein